MFTLLQQHIRLCLTFVWHKRAGFEVQPLAGARADLLDVVAESVTTVFAAVQTDTLVKCCVVSALVGHDLFVSVQQRVNEKVHSSLVGTFQRLLEACTQTDRNKMRIRNWSYLQMLLLYVCHHIVSQGFNADLFSALMAQQCY